MIVTAMTNDTYVTKSTDRHNLSQSPLGVPLSKALNNLQHEPMYCGLRSVEDILYSHGMIYVADLTARTADT